MNTTKVIALRMMMRMVMTRVMMIRMMMMMMVILMVVVMLVVMMEGREAVVKGATRASLCHSQRPTWRRFFVLTPSINSVCLYAEARTAETKVEQYTESSSCMPLTKKNVGLRLEWSPYVWWYWSHDSKLRLATRTFIPTLFTSTLKD